MRIGDLVRWYRKDKHTDNIGIVIQKAKQSDRVRIRWLKDQSVGWYSDSYLEVLCE